MKAGAQATRVSAVYKGVQCKPVHKGVQCSAGKRKYGSSLRRGNRVHGHYTVSVVPLGVRPNLHAQRRQRTPSTLGRGRGEALGTVVHVSPSTTVHMRHGDGGCEPVGHHTRDAHRVQQIPASRARAGGATYKQKVTHSAPRTGPPHSYGARHHANPLYLQRQRDTCWGTC